MNDQKNSKSGIDRLYDFFGSIKLSIFVLFALALSSIIGTVLQQGEEADFYLKTYGEKWGGVISALNLGDMYHAWWFQVLLGLLLVNISFCSLKRLPQALRQMKDRDPVIDGRSVAIHERREIPTSQAAVSAADKVSALLGSKLGPVAREERDGVVYLFATRGAWSRMGVYVTHLSLFLFALGALIGLQWGFKGAVNIPEGTTATEMFDRTTGGMTPIGFGVRCDDFDLEYYAGTDRTKAYVSNLTVLEDGKEVLKKRIVVNDPLIYKGYYFYQSNYGKQGLQGFTLSVADKADPSFSIDKLSMKPGDRINLPDGSALVPLSLNEGQGHSGIVMGILKDGHIAERGLVNQPDDCGVWWPVGGYQVRLDGMDWRFYTGLSVAKDPGVPVVWAGCFLISLGLMASFFASHRRVWARVEPKGSGAEVTLLGNASRNRIAFEKWFEEFQHRVQESFENTNG